MSIYLLHIDPPLKHARHYIGFCEGDPEDRLKQHLSGRGSPLIKAAVAAGSSITIAHVIPDGDRTMERRLKNRGGAARWCPVCGVNTRPLPSCETIQEAA
jgi:hypothetical protein